MMLFTWVNNKTKMQIEEWEESWGEIIASFLPILLVVFSSLHNSNSIKHARHASRAFIGMFTWFEVMETTTTTCYQKVLREEVSRRLGWFWRDASKAQEKKEEWWWCDVTWNWVSQVMWGLFPVPQTTQDERTTWKCRSWKVCCMCREREVFSQMFTRVSPTSSNVSSF